MNEETAPTRRSIIPYDMLRKKERGTLNIRDYFVPLRRVKADFASV